jgi:hypothetical protein
MKGLVAAATLFFILSFSISTFIITFTQYIHPSPFAEASLHFFLACCLEGKTSLGCRAEIRTRACHTAQYQLSYTLHPNIYITYFEKQRKTPFGRKKNNKQDHMYKIGLKYRIAILPTCYN